MNPSSKFSIYSKQCDILLERIVVLVLAIPFVIVGIPGLVMIGLLFKLNQEFAVISAKVFKRGQLIKPLSSISSIMANIEDIYKSPRNVIVSAVILEGVPNMQRIRDTIKLQLLDRAEPQTGKLMYPELFQNISYWMGYPFWRKLDSEKASPEWILQECVRFYENDENLESNFHMLDKLLRQLCFVPFCKEKPLIEVIILPNYTPHPVKNAGLLPDGKYFCLLARNHHALADAFALFKILQNLSTTAESNQVEYIQAHDYSKQVKLRGRSVFIKLFKTLRIIPRMLYELTQSAIFLIVNSTASSIWPTRKTRKIVSTNYCSSMSDTELNSRRCHNFVTAHGKQFSMSEINEIKEIHGVSGTAVLFAAMIGATTKTLFNCSDILPPSYAEFAVILPLPGHKGLLDNRFTPGMMQIAIGEPDAIKRLHKMNTSIQKLKKSTLPASLALIAVTLLGQFPRWIIHPIADILSTNLEILLSTNIAGPKQMFDIAGYPVRDVLSVFGIASEKTIPLFIMISIGGKARLTVTSDSSVISTVEQAELLAHNFLSELETLRQNNDYINIVNV